jgi:phosphoribosylformylglycinamidine (FGAM) synthase-like enzyme
MCLAGGYGVDLDLTFTNGLRRDAALFGEWPSRIICELAAEGGRQLREMAAATDVPFTTIGTVGKPGDGISSATLSVGRDDLLAAWEGEALQPSVETLLCL